MNNKANSKKQTAKGKKKTAKHTKRVGKTKTKLTSWPQYNSWYEIDQDVNLKLITWLLKILINNKLDCNKLDCNKLDLILY